MAHLSNKSRFFIGTTAAAETLLQYEADTYVEIHDVHDLGEVGDTWNPVEYATMEDSRTKRLKGTVDGGMMELIVNRRAADLGQKALALAAKNEGYESSADYNFKMVLPDKPGPGGTGTVLFFKGAVLGGRVSFGEVDNVVRTTWQIAINSGWLEVEPDPA